MSRRIILCLLPLLLVACHVQMPMNSSRFVQDVQKDMPFRAGTLTMVPNHTNIYSFSYDGLVDLLPDYEVDAEGTCMVYRTTFMSTHDKQPEKVIWRNIVINRNAKRVLCIDRLLANGRTIGYVYVLQAETKDYSDENTFHWDVSDQRLMLNVADALEGMSHLSITQLELQQQK